MKEGWILKRLFEVGSFQRGKGIQKVDFVNNGMPCIHYGQIHTSFGIATSQHISEISEELFSQSVIARTGDLLFALTSEDVEGSCKATAWMGYYDVAVSSDAAIFRHTLNPKFVSYFFGSKAFFRQKQKFARGFKVTHIKTSDVASFEILVPPLAEQERIVAELDLLTEIIDKQKTQIKELDTLAQSIFYDMFGDPVDNDKGWDVKKLGTVLKTTSGGTPAKGHPEYYEGGDILWINSGDLHQTYVYSVPKRITKEGLSKSSAKLFPVDTVLVAMYGATVGEVSILKVESATNQAVCGIFPDPLYNTIFLYSVLKRSKNHFIDLAAGGAQPNISQTIIKDFELITPPIDLQRDFADKINAIEQQKAAITQSIAETQKLFDYTMDKYFG